MAVKTKMADVSLVSRVKTRRNNSQKHGKNSKITTQRETSTIWRISAELNNPTRAISPDELNIDGGKLVLAMFLN